MSCSAQTKTKTDTKHASPHQLSPSSMIARKIQESTTKPYFKCKQNDIPCPSNGENRIYSFEDHPYSIYSHK